MPWKNAEDRNTWMRKYRAENKERLRARDRQAETRWREKNKEHLKEKQRARRAANIDHYREYNAKWHRENRANNPQKVRAMHLKSHYGITPEQYGILLVAQDGRCGICPRLPADEKYGVLAVDHDHKTGAVRGLLCADCNRGGGMFNDDPELLRKAVEWFSKS